jgi:hypothetical protein
MRNSDGRYYINQLSIDNSYSAGVNCFYGKPVDKLAEFEDFMEEVGAESLDEIETCIVDLNKENQTLKGNWAKLREWVWDKEPLFKGANAIFKKSEVLEKMRELEGGNEVVEN